MEVNMSEKDILKEIEDFHEERIKKLKNNETPKHFPEGGKTVLHLIPMESISEPKEYEISAIQQKAKDLLQPMFAKGKAYYEAYNFDGLLNFLSAKDGTCLSYIQLYRSGIIETVEAFYFTREEKNIPIYTIEQEIILKTENYLSFQKEMGILPPVVCYLTLLSVKGYSISDRSIDIHFLDIHPFDREDLILPKIIMKDFEIDTGEIFKISFDRIWNACGYPRSFQYNEKGEFIAK